MAAMETSAKQFFRGPAWFVAGALGVLSTAVGIIEGAVWMWLSFGLLLLVVASFVSFHRGRTAAQEKAQALPRRIDDLHRAGIKLASELSEPIEPKQAADGTVSISFDAPPERWEKAEVFDQEIRELFIEAYPALLSDYAAGFNNHRRKMREQEAARAPDPETDTRPNAIKLKEFTDHMHRKPAQVVEASLEGLAAARHRVGNWGGA